MDTLAFGYALGAIPCARDFHPLDCAHAWHTKKGGVRNVSLFVVKNFEAYSTVETSFSN